MIDAAPGRAIWQKTTSRASRTYARAACRRRVRHSGASALKRTTPVTIAYVKALASGGPPLPACRRDSGAARCGPQNGSGGLLHVFGLVNIILLLLLLYASPRQTHLLLPRRTRVTRLGKGLRNDLRCRCLARPCSGTR